MSSRALKSEQYHQARDEKLALIEHWRAQGHAQPAEWKAMLKDADWSVRGLAAQALGDTGDAEASRELMPLLEDPEPTNRVDAIEALAALQYKPAVNSLLLLADHEPDPLVRSAIVEALGELGDGSPAVLRALRRLLNNEDATVRSEAAKSLGDLDGERAAAVLRERLTVEQEPAVRAVLLGTLADVGDTHALKLLIELLHETQDWSLRTAILNTLADIASDETRQQIMDAIDHLARREPDAAGQFEAWSRSVLESLNLS